MSFSLTPALRVKNTLRNGSEVLFLHPKSRKMAVFATIHEISINPNFMAVDAQSSGPLKIQLKSSMLSLDGYEISI